MLQCVDQCVWGGDWMADYCMRGIRPDGIDSIDQPVVFRCDHAWHFFVTARVGRIGGRFV